MSLEEGIRRFTITTPDWGEVLILRPLPDEDSAWGVLECLRESLIGPLIPVASGEDFAHALHGMSTPLMRCIGRPPDRLLKMIPEEHRICSLSKTCIMYDKKICFPGPKTPLCYEAPGFDTSEGGIAAAIVVQAWKEGRYVVVVEGEEFSL